ncbi:MAG: C1 family peptidase [Lachnospiraceae bacterium]|nr:C1 family peptidase [Lachnospiraceae bacterium]
MANEAGAFLPGGAWELDIGKEIQTDPFCYEDNGADTPAYNDEAISVEKNGDPEYDFDASYDPRDEGLVTEVKDQGRTALCWDYACNSTAESALIKQGMCDSSVDLSEFHTAYHVYEKQKDKGSISESVTFVDFCHDGGRLSYVWEIWEEGIGPAEESKYPMPESVSENTVMPTDGREECVKRLASVIRLRSDSVDDVKQAILENGAVAALYYSYGDYYKDAVNDQSDSSYYMPYDVKTRNHAISIVGWDDDFPAESFIKDFRRIQTEDGNTEDAPLPDGAWLIKNSWGKRAYRTPDEASGYYWISYYDKSLTDFTAILFADPSAESTGDVDYKAIEGSLQELNEKEYRYPNGIAEIQPETEIKQNGIREWITVPMGVIRPDLSETSKKKPADHRKFKTKTSKRKKYRRKKAKTIRVNGIIYGLQNKKAIVIKVKRKKKRVRIPACIKYKGRKYRVTKISKNAFSKSRVIRFVIIKQRPGNKGL